MNDDVATISSKIKARSQAHTIAYCAAGMGEEQMPTATACELLNCFWQMAVLLFKPLQRLVAAMVRVHIENDEPRSLSGGDA